MSRIKKATQYTLAFLAIEIFVYFIEHTVFAITVNRVDFWDSANKAFLELIWRLIALQIPIQIIIFVLVILISRKDSYLVLTIAAILSFLAPIVSSPVRLDFLGLFKPYYLNGLGPGFAFIVSCSAAWLLLKLVRIRGVTSSS